MSVKKHINNNIESEEIEFDNWMKQKEIEFQKLSISESLQILSDLYRWEDQESDQQDDQ